MASRYMTALSITAPVRMMYLKRYVQNATPRQETLTYPFISIQPRIRQRKIKRPQERKFGLRVQQVSEEHGQTEYLITYLP